MNVNKAKGRAKAARGSGVNQAKEETEPKGVLLSEHVNIRVMRCRRQVWFALEDVCGLLQTAFSDSFVTHADNEDEYPFSRELGIVDKIPAVTKKGFMIMLQRDEEAAKEAEAVFGPEPEAL